VLKRLRCLLVLAVLLCARPASADDAGDAKVHYQKATAHYAVGEYKEAAAEYEAAFKAKQDPALLYNAAQSHRLAGDNQKALLLYKNLVKLYPNTKYAAEAKDRIEKLEQAIATTQSPPNSPAPVDSAPQPQPAGAVPPAAPPPPAAPAAAPAPAPVALTATAAPAAPEKRPVYKQWWFWAGAGGVALVAVIAIVALSGGSSGTWANLPEQHALTAGAVRW